MKMAVRKVLVQGGPQAAKCFWKYMPMARVMQPTVITTLESEGGAFSETADKKRIITEHFNFLGPNSKQARSQPYLNP